MSDVALFALGAILGGCLTGAVALWSSARDFRRHSASLARLEAENRRLRLAVSDVPAPHQEGTP